MDLQRAYEWLARHPGGVDAVIAGIATVLLTGPVLAAGTGDTSASDVARVALSAVQTVSLAWRRSRPVPMFTALALACLAQLFVLQEPLPSNIIYPVAMFAVTVSATSRRLRLATLGVAVLAGLLSGIVWTHRADSVVGTVISTTFLLGTSVVTWVAADLVRNRRAVLSRLAEQNEALRRERDQRTQLAAQAERTRIAREMHDIVAHSLSVIVVQADGGAYAAEHASGWDREQGRRTLETVATTAREALAETRRLVGVLRDAETGADYAPTATLTDLDDLVARVGSSGLPVRLDRSGDLGDVPREVDVAAYRVVQESLTNVLKHAGPGARALVELRRDADTLVLRVTDDGRGAAPDPGDGGNGLVGMRERALSVGGSLHAAPRPGGGFEVRATLPVGGTA